MPPQKGFANIAVFIILLLTMGGTVVYFKNFPLEKLPAEQPQKEEVEKPTAVPAQVPAVSEQVEEVKKVTVDHPVANTAVTNQYQQNETRPLAVSNTQGTTTEKDLQEARDKKRLSDIKKIQGVLDRYSDVCGGGYPLVKTSTIIGSSQLDLTFNTGCRNDQNLGSVLYLYLVDRSMSTQETEAAATATLPMNPKPGGMPYEYCAEDEFNNPGKCGVPKGGLATSYRLTFKLESQQGSLVPGVHVATPWGGIK